MSMKGFKRMLLGEKMPDRNDPQYKERYEREVCAGRKFARITRFDKAVAKVQGFANLHRTLFLVIVFGFLAASLAWNIYRMTVVVRHRTAQRTATEMQDSVLHLRRVLPQQHNVQSANNEKR